MYVWTGINVVGSHLWPVYVTRTAWPRHSSDESREGASAWPFSSAAFLFPILDQNPDAFVFFVVSSLKYLALTGMKMGEITCAVLLNYLGLIFYRTASEVSSERWQETAVIPEQCLIFRAGKLYKKWVCCRTHSFEVIVILLKCITGFAHLCPSSLLTLLEQKNFCIQLSLSIFNCTSMCMDCTCATEVCTIALKDGCICRSHKSPDTLPWYREIWHITVIATQLKRANASFPATPLAWLCLWCATTLELHCGFSQGCFRPRSFFPLRAFKRIRWGGFTPPFW